MIGSAGIAVGHGALAAHVQNTRAVHERGGGYFFWTFAQMGCNGYSTRMENGHRWRCSEGRYTVQYGSVL